MGEIVYEFSYTIEMSGICGYSPTDGSKSGRMARLEKIRQHSFETASIAAAKID